MKETLERASRGAAELSDDMLNLVSGGADVVDERKQSLLDMIDKVDQYKADQDRKKKEESAAQNAVQNAMLQGLKNSQL